MRCVGGSGLAAAAFALASLATVAAADAHVRREGAWPDADKPVTLDADGLPRRDALRKLADAAGWSLVVHAPPGDAVDVHVKGQPASKVLDLLLDDGDYVARRDGTLVSIDHATASAASAVPAVAPVASAPVASAPVARGAVAPAPAIAPPAASASVALSDGHKADDVRIELGDHGSQIIEPHKRGQDRTVMGGNVTIARGEMARDVTVFGGNVDIDGEATGDITVFGGSARVHRGGRVRGDAMVYGGSLRLDKDARVDGDVSTTGGSLDRDPGSIVGGDVSVEGGREASDEEAKHADRPGLLHRTVESFIGGVRLAAVLFVVGTVLLALAGRRMEALRGEVAVRPMRSMALGLVGTFTGIVVLIALTVTGIGIPVAVVVAIVAGFAVLAAMCAVLSVVGEGLLRHRTENPYAHLALGCALFVALSSIPWVGVLVVIAVALVGVGVLVATRGAGFLVRKNGRGGPTSAYGAEPTIP